MTAMIPGTSIPLNSKFWLGDSNASMHMGPSNQGMYDYKYVQISVMVGTGAKLVTTKLGKQCIKIYQVKGPPVIIVLEDYEYVPGL